MKTIKERFHDFGIDDDGEVVPIEDFADALPISNESIVQGMANLREWNREQSCVLEAEQEARLQREQAVADLAMQNAGVFVSLDEHRRNQRELVDIASDISMYKGGEKGGYSSKRFQDKYQQHSTDVEQGARRNHRKRVHEDLPRIYKAAELAAAGFDPVDIEMDAKTTMRSELMSRLGGPENKKARADRRKHFQ